MDPTNEQLAISTLFRESSDNIIIEALAGCGKTSTLELLHAGSKTEPILFLAFNVHIKEEMEARIKAKLKAGIKLPLMEIRTFNGCGHGIWGYAQSTRLSVDKKKTQNILAEQIKDLPKHRRGEAWRVFWDVSQAIDLAKSLGYVPPGVFPNAKRLITPDAFYASLEESPDDLARELIDSVLTASIKAAYAGNIDYNDQIYMPALFGGTFPRFPLVMVDEDQDLSPTNHAMLDKLARDRLIAVGDPWQSIYGFRGAEQGGMARQKAKFKMTQAGLTISFRCPEKIVENVRWRVPQFKWVKPGGKVEQLTRLEGADIPDSSAVICRNNAPLFRLAFALLQRKRSVSVSGSEIGPKVIGIMRKLGDEHASRAQAIALIEDWRAAKAEKGSTSANDLADCMKVFASYGETLGQAISYAEHLFAQKGSIQLLTGHKSKGLEWDIVYHLDPWLIGEEEQELNLRYVIGTRSKQELYEINSKDIR
jgi:superfamily I DNA/RNA helicase